MSDQKTPNPRIENIIKETLIGEMQKDALDFTAFLHANEFHIEFNPNEYEKGKWTGAIGALSGIA